MIPDEDQRALQEVARRFARERLLPHYIERERIGILDRDLLREMGRLGLLGVDLPEQHGGLGTSSVTTGIIAEELAYGDFNVSAVQIGTSLLGAILQKNAPAHIADHWLPRMVAGEAIVAICVTEPRGGSDAANLALRARRDGDDYILSGEKTSITFADCADAYLTFARTGRPEDGARGVSAFLVPADARGLERRRFDDVGSRIIGRGPVFFDDVRVPASQLVGPLNKGFTEVMVDEGHAAPAAHARRHGPRDRRRHRRCDEADRRPRARRSRSGPVSIGQYQERGRPMGYRSAFRPGLFDGQVVIVTGGGSGIGRCTAHELASLGARVALVGPNGEKLHQLMPARGPEEHEHERARRPRSNERG